MMNSNFVAERARSLAKHLLRSGNGGERRVKRAWYNVLGGSRRAEISFEP